MPSWMKWTIALLIGFVIIVVGFRWFSWLLTSFFVLNCLVLMIVVLLQSGKAADLAGAFGGAGSQTAFGPRGAASILSQATTWCAVMFMICAFAMVLRTDKASRAGWRFGLAGNLQARSREDARHYTRHADPGAPDFHAAEQSACVERFTCIFEARSPAARSDTAEETVALVRLNGA